MCTYHTGDSSPVLCADTLDVDSVVREHLERRSQDARVAVKVEDLLQEQAKLLREADAARLLGKYVVADQLEQVTTCFSLRDLLKRRARL